MIDIFDHWPAPLDHFTRGHATVSVEYILTASDDDLDGMLVDGETKMPLTPNQMRWLAAQHKYDGRTHLPPCDHTDEHGLCAGHPIYQLAKGW